MFSADGERVVALLRAGSWPSHGIQLIGDGLLTALARDIDGASGFAVRCAAELRARDWTGDEELAAALTARLGTGPSALLRALPVDLDQLVDVLEGDPVMGVGYLDLHTGEVWPQAVFDDGLDDEEDDEDLDDDERWLWVHQRRLTRRVPRHGALHRRHHRARPRRPARKDSGRQGCLPTVQT